MLLVQKAGFPVEYAGADVPPYLIVDGVPQHRGTQQHEHAQGITEVPRAGYRSCREEQGIAGKKRRNDQSRLAEDDDEEKKIQQGTVFGDEGEQVLINMDDEG